MARALSPLSTTSSHLLPRGSLQRRTRSSWTPSCLRNASKRRLVRARSGAAELGQTLELTEENVELVLDEVRTARRGSHLLASETKAMANVRNRN